MDPLSMDDSWLHGYAIAGVGGVVADAQVRIGPLAKMNFLVGRNNHGKSTLLRAAKHWTSRRSTTTATGKRETLVPVGRDDLAKMLRQCGVKNHAERDRRLSTFIDLDAKRLGVWVERSNSSNTTGAAEQRSLNAALKDQLGITNYSVNYPGSPLPHVAARSILIPAFRQMRDAGPEQKSPDLASGEGLVAELSTWERPKRPGTADYLEAKERWSRLQALRAGRARGS